MGGKNSGGARPGSGKKPKNFSDEIRKDVAIACQKMAKETGRTFGDVLVEMFWERNTKQPQLRLGAANIIKEILVIKESHQTIDKHETGPRIGLPPIKAPGPDEVFTINAPKGLMN